MPVNLSLYAAFWVAMVFMAISPGPAIMYCIRTGLSGSKAAVLAAVVGLNLGNIVWFIGASLGLLWLVKAFPLFFSVLAALGGLYVVYLAATSLWVTRQVGQGLNLKAQNQNVKQAFWQGMVVQLTNPKALLFFTAVLPPFLDAKIALGPQLVVFAATTVFIDALSMGGYGLSAAGLAGWLQDGRKKQAFDRATNLILAGIGIFITAHSVLNLLSPHPH